MTADLHARVSELFLAAVDLPTGERGPFLDRACGSDPNLQREVASLLERDGRPAVLDRPVGSGQIREAIAEACASPGSLPEQIGGYRILGLLGQGGMGTVYRARQTNPDRLVALKVISAAAVSPALHKRFEFEAQVLARLQHPGIAQIYEAGIAHDAGRPVPFFAMELIEGRPLTDYARRCDLTPKQRLALMLKVCDAVQHAHQKGVIHRDLKPANILVADEGTRGSRDQWTEADSLRSTNPPSVPRSLSPSVPASPQPKILDFGVARTIDPDLQTMTLATLPGQIVGTLPYMSPEQVSGDAAAVDTRSDIYSLGVTAYELLTERLPYDLRDKPLADAARIIQDAAPARLSSIDRVWRGDLDTIIAKALEKEKERRYASVSDFAADIERFLRDEPIAARPPSRMYQFRKFARRNRLLVGSSAAAVLFLIAAVVGTAIGWSRASAAEGKARRKQAESEAVSQFLVRILMTPAPAAQGRDVTVVEALEVARSQVETAFPDQPEARAAVLGELGAVYHAMGRPQESLSYLRRAYELRREALGDHHAETLQSINNLGIALIDPNDPARMKEAEALLQQALEVARAVHGTESVQAAGAHNALAHACWAAGDHQRAESLTREALRIGRKLGVEGDSVALASMINLAVLSGHKGDNAAKEAQLRDVLALGERTQGRDHPDMLQTAMQLANALVAQGRYSEAETIFLENINRRTRVLGEDHPETLTSAHEYALCLFRLGRRDECERLLRQTLERERRALGPDHHVTGSTLSCLADVLFRDGRYEEAEKCYEELAATAEKLQGRDGPLTVVNRVWLALCAAEQGRLSDASNVLDDAAPRIKPDDAEYSYARRLHGVAHAKQMWTRGEFAPAETALLKAEQTFRDDWGPDHVCTRLSQMYLAQLYAAWNKPEAAVEWRAKLISQDRG